MLLKDFKNPALSNNASVSIVSCRVINLRNPCTIIKDTFWVAVVCYLQKHARTFSTDWLGNRVVSVLDSGAVGPGFKSQPRRCRITVLGKLFTHRASVHQAAKLLEALLTPSLPDSLLVFTFPPVPAKIAKKVNIPFRTGLDIVYNATFVRLQITVVSIGIRI